MQNYDFIIAGGGLAGLSLAYYMNQTVLRDKSILIIDQDTKSQNDRTWCFWEKDPQSPFDS
ncbi:MAG TPA: lycopene cyclase, partial [Runella sp.]|nr:lycopene cyclase [Runella sp.]